MNLTRGTVVAFRTEVAEGFRARLMGLLGRRSLKRGEALLIPACRAIHTVGMHLAIDVLFLDTFDRVVKVVRGLPPWRVAAASSFSVVELPEGALDTSRTRQGDLLKIQARTSSADSQRAKKG